MFRQQYQANCNCSLFPQPSIAQNPPFRSPQRFNPHKENKSKKSLKCHSSSRTKNIQKSSFAFNAAKIPNIGKQIHPQNNANLLSLANAGPSTMRHHDENSKNYSQNVFTNHYFASKQNDMMKQRNVMKQSSQSLNQNYMSTRAASPLNPYDLNSQKRVTFNYQNDYDFRPTSNKMFTTSPPPPQKSDHRSSQATSTTTLMGSCIPNHSELRKKYLQQKSNWSKQSITQVSSQANKTSHIENYLAMHSPQSSKMDYFSRPRTSTNVFGLSRLTQMMNEKEEIQSIYEGQRGHDEGGIEYSRVLISCRKLMEDKNGILQQSAQTRLFDYEEIAKGIIFKKSGLFDQINIQSK